MQSVLCSLLQLSSPLYSNCWNTGVIAYITGTIAESPYIRCRPAHRKFTTKRRHTRSKEIVQATGQKNRKRKQPVANILERKLRDWRDSLDWTNSITFSCSTRMLQGWNYNSIKIKEVDLDKSVNPQPLQPRIDTFHAWFHFMKLPFIENDGIVLHMITITCPVHCPKHIMHIQFCISVYNTYPIQVINNLFLKN